MLCLMIAACADAAGHSLKVCGPFGDPPADLIEAPRPFCPGGIRLGPWMDSNATPRYACLYEPDTGPQTGPLPLLVYLHPSLFGTGTIYLTNLLHYQNSLPMEPDGRRGFIVLEPTGRKTTHYYPFPDQKGVGWDNWYRQLNPTGDVTVGGTTYKENVDAAAIDHFIAQQTATGKVDTRRIYLTGWSNGAAMAYLYALNRPNVAAIAVYSPPDPFGAFDDPCPQKPVLHPPSEDDEIRIFNPNLPSMDIHNNCDAVGLCANSERLAVQLQAIGMSVDNVIVNALGEQVSKCMQACGTNPMGDADPVSNPLGWTLGLANHSRWPLTWTRTMLEFLRNYPLK